MWLEDIAYDIKYVICHIKSQYMTYIIWWCYQDDKPCEMFRYGG